MEFVRTLKISRTVLSPKFCSGGNLQSIGIMDFDSDSDTIDDIYEVEKIIDAKKKDGKVLFKVRWEGYGSEEDSWEPNDNLLTCQELVDRYWLEKKDGYKKRGRKPKRLREMAGEDSDTDDSNRKDQNDDESEMTTPPEKRRRGRPPKHPGSEGMDEKKRLAMDGSSSTSPELSEGNSAKKKRRRPPKDDEYLSRFAPSEFLLLDLPEIAPLGLTRQASKELALVSLRKKHEHDHMAETSSGTRVAIVEASSDATPENTAESSETSDVETSTVYPEQDAFEVIEISSQDSVDDEREDFSQDSEPTIIKECIVISSQSESEGEGEKLAVKSTLNSAKTKLKKKNKKEKTLTQDAGKDRVEKAENNVDKKKAAATLKKSLSVENQANKNDDHSSVDDFPPIDFSFESGTGVSQGRDDSESFLQSSKELEIETSKVFDLSGQETDENSNQVTCSLLRAELSSKLSMSKMQTLRDTIKDKTPASPGSMDNNNKCEKKSADLSNITDESASKLSPLSLVRGSFAENSLSEASAMRRENNEMEYAATRRSLDEDNTSQLYNQHLRAMKRLGGERKNKGKAKRSEGRPKSHREVKKRRPSIDTTAATQQNSSGAEYLAGPPISDAQGKMDKHNIPSTTADLLPMQNKTKSVPLMDGDLIGAIIQESGNDSDSKVKPLTSAPAAKKEGKNPNHGKTPQDKTQDEAETLRSWDSGMEDISDGEDDLSDFEFDLDDYSPHSFFNEAEESNVAARASSPAAEPLNLSWAALKQAIREGDTMLVRRALAVPGFNPDTIDTASGMTLLMWAATIGQDEIVRLLLRRGAGVNTDPKRTGMTALMHAAEQGFPETVQILLESGAHINWQQTAGETALMKACKKGHEEVVEVLLRHGVDTKAQSNYEQTAVQIALRNQHLEIQNLLSEHEKSLESTLQIALGKCLGTAGTLRTPLVMPYRCIAPGEKESVTFTLKYNPSKGPQGTKVVLFCVRADFNGDEVCLSFCGDNGIRSVLLNASIQYPLVQGNRSVYLLNLDTEASSNELTVETHPVKSRLLVCVANVSPVTDSS